MGLVTVGTVDFPRPENLDNPHRLGQHLTLDARSLGYAARTERAARHVRLRSRSWEVHLPVLDQGQVGSCVGDTGTEELAADPIYATLPVDLAATLDQTYAYRLYSDCTREDRYRGTWTYPPGEGEDTGTSGLACQRVLRRRGLIASYRWATSLRGVVTLLQDGPVALGCPWYQSMFYPDPGGFVRPVGGLAGGHETLLFAVEVQHADTDLAGTVLTARNHWGASWGDHGCYRLRIEDLATLRRDGSDFKQGVPLAEDAQLLAGGWG